MVQADIFAGTWWVFAVMVGVFLFTAFIRKSAIGAALMLGAVAGWLAGDWFLGMETLKGNLFRHLVEGAFTYFDPILIIFTALVFMRVIEENGALSAIARTIIEKFGKTPALLIVVVTLFIMFPAMLTGITTTSMLTTGALMAPVLIAMGMPKLRVGAMVAIISMMGMFAPPINLLVMLIGQGVDMPYIGFDGILLAIALPIALITAFTSAYPYLRKADPAKAAGQLPEIPAGTNFWVLLSPLLVVFILMFAVRLLPAIVPDIGAPLIFVIGTIVAMFTGKKVHVPKALYKALVTGLPVLGLLTGIGMFLQIMTLTGVRGLLVVTVLSLPIALTYLGLLVSLPAFGGVSAFASAMVFGIPFLLSLLGGNEIVTCAGIALLAAMGDVIPPSAIEARFAAQIVGEDSFMKIVVRCLPYLALMAIVALAVIHWSNGLSFLTPKF